jgi:hypothetical protein
MDKKYNMSFTTGGLFYAESLKALEVYQEEQDINRKSYSGKDTKHCYAQSTRDMFSPGKTDGSTTAASCHRSSPGAALSAMGGCLQTSSSYQ